jgi:hypothetical protein
MNGKHLQAMEEDGIVKYDEQRDEWVEVDEDGIFMYTIDRHDSDAEEFKREAKEKPVDKYAEVAMSRGDFYD